MAMSDPTKGFEDRPYGFWNRAGLWVAAHPKTTIVIALMVLGVCVWLFAIL